VIRFACSWSASLGCLAALAAGCGGGGGDVDAGFDAGPTDTGPDAPVCSEFMPEYCPVEYPMDPVPLAAICETFADMFCRANGRCCERPAEVYTTFMACRLEQVSRCMDPVLGYEYRTALMTGNLDYNAAAVGEQRARLGRMSDACVPIHYGDAILSSMDGNVPSGGACMVSAECTMGTDCRGGLCGAHLGPGATCATNDECAPRMNWCSATQCTARRANGQTCTESAECTSRLCVDGTCTDFTGDVAYCVRQGLGTAGIRPFER
jgi:hypothetical protein